MVRPESEAVTFAVDLEDAALLAAADGHARGRPGDRLSPVGILQLELAAAQRDRLVGAETVESKTIVFAWLSASAWLMQ